MSFYEKIIEYLHENNIWFEETSHEPVFTSKQAANVRGGGVIEMGAKALVFGKDSINMLVLRGCDKVDNKKAKKLLQVKDLPLSSPEKVFEVTGVKIGAVAPFGFLVGVSTYVDKKLLDNEFIFFNPGKHDKTIKMYAKDFFGIKDIKVSDFSKE